VLLVAACFLLGAAGIAAAELAARHPVPAAAGLFQMPEPMTLVLLGLAGVVLLPRRVRGR
jgi:hypothetical protein